MKDLDIGIIGLGVMGQNLALNIADKGFTVGGWDAWPDPGRAAGGQGGDRTACTPSSRCPSCWRSLRRPRRIIMLVKAGEVVDKTIAALRPLLDGGRHDRRRRQRVLPQHRAARRPSWPRTGSASSAWASRAARRARATVRR